MAKSKSGGTRAYLRGRIASDVYSIGRDASGKKQQVVRSLAEQVANPQTIAQMRGRMIMSTVMQAVSGMAPIIDHSFDNVPNGQPSISEFIRRNYALIKADVSEHPAAGNTFGLNQYQEKGVKGGAYIISDGAAILPSYVDVSLLDAGAVTFVGNATDLTAGALRDRFGVTEDDFFTLCFITNDGEFTFLRASISNALADDTEISDANAEQMFIIDNPFGLPLEFSFAEGQLGIAVTRMLAFAGGVIFSNSNAGKFDHSKCVLRTFGELPYTADVALPTYPIGTERFLNGGEL